MRCCLSRHAEKVAADKLRQDHGRQRTARGRADSAEVCVGRGEAVRPRCGRNDGRLGAQPVPGEHVEGCSPGENFHRLFSRTSGEPRRWWPIRAGGARGRRCRCHWRGTNCAVLPVLRHSMCKTCPSDLASCGTTPGGSPRSDSRWDRAKETGAAITATDVDNALKPIRYQDTLPFRRATGSHRHRRGCVRPGPGVGWNPAHDSRRRPGSYRAGRPGRRAWPVPFRRLRDHAANQSAKNAAGPGGDPAGREQSNASGGRKAGDCRQSAQRGAEAPPASADFGVKVPAGSWCSNWRKCRSTILSEQTTEIWLVVKPAASISRTARSASMSVVNTPARMVRWFFSAFFSVGLVVVAILISRAPRLATGADRGS